MNQMTHNLNTLRDFISKLLDLKEVKLYANLGIIAQKSKNNLDAQLSIQFLNEIILNDIADTELIAPQRFSDEILGEHLFNRLNLVACNLLCINPFDDGQTIRSLEDKLGEDKINAALYLSSILVNTLGVLPEVAILSSVIIIKTFRELPSIDFGRSWKAEVKKALDSHLIDSSNKTHNESEELKAELESLKKLFYATNKKLKESEIESLRQTINALIKESEIFLLKHQYLEALVTAVKLAKKSQKHIWKTFETQLQSTITLHKVLYSIKEKTVSKGRLIMTGLQVLVSVLMARPLLLLAGQAVRIELVNLLNSGVLMVL